MNNKNKKIIIVVSLLIVVALTCMIIFKSKIGFSSGRRECPQHWYQDDMPVFSKNSKPEDRQYMVIDDETVSPRDMDVEWVKSHCSVNSPSIVE